MLRSTIKMMAKRSSILALTLIMTLSFASTFSMEEKVGSHTVLAQSISSKPAPSVRAKQPPTGAGTFLDAAYDSATSPFNTIGGKGVDEFMNYIARNIGSPEKIEAATRKAKKAITNMMKSKGNIEKQLSKLTKGTKGYNRTMKTLTKKLERISRQEDLVKSSFKKLRNLKALKFGGKALALNGIYTDANALLEGKYKHKHSSMRFLRDAVLASNVAINSLLEMPIFGDKFKATPLGKGAEAFALGLGLTKDYVTSDSFVDYMNKTDNKVLRVSDEIIDNTNKYWTKKFTGWVIGWDQYWGNTPTDEQLAQLDKHLAELRKRKGLGRKPGDNIGAYKPNIYLYPDEEMQVQVQFEIPGLLDTVIPEYPGEWLVQAYPDGRIIAEDGQAYTFLFYESITWPWLYQTREGWYIDADQRSEQMEEIMIAYGFTEQETADFVEYWKVKLDQGYDYAMYPQLTPTIDIAMPIHIEPKPDQLFRIWFAFEKEARPEELSQAEMIVRDGFTVVEWGGVILPE